MKISTTKQLSAYLKDVRLDNELSQPDVAKKVGVRQDAVSNFELRAGSTKLERGVVMAILDVYLVGEFK